MSHLILAARLRRKIDYTLDILSFIDSQTLRDEIKNILHSLKTALIEFNNLLAKKDNPIAENKIPEMWSALHENFLFQWEKLSERKDLHTILSQQEQTKLQIDWVETIEDQIKKVFESSPELDIEELREIAKQRLLEYELVQFGESVKNLLLTKPPSCFISYAWGNQTHEEQVHQIAYLLKRTGIDVLLDIWCNKVNSVPQFTELVNKEKSQFVVVIGTHLLKQKYAVQTTGKGSWVHEELEQVAVRKRDNPGDHGIIKLLLEGPVDKAFPDFLDPLAHDYTNFDLNQNYYEKFFNLLELLYEKYSEVKFTLVELRKEFNQDLEIIEQTLEKDLRVLLKLNNSADYLALAERKRAVLSKLRKDPLLLLNNDNQKPKKNKLKVIVFILLFITAIAISSVLFWQKIKEFFKFHKNFINNSSCEELKLFSQLLKNKYLDNQTAVIERTSYEKTFPIEHSFINLAIIKKTEYQVLEKEVHQKNTRDEIMKSFEGIFLPKDAIQLNKIFDGKIDNNLVPKHILIEGRAGIGKTVLLKFIANRWAAGDISRIGSKINQFLAVILLPLRRMLDNNNITNDLVNFIYTECLLSEDQNRLTLNQHQLQTVIDELERQHAVLYLLDGYDEVSTLINEKKASHSAELSPRAKLLNSILKKEYWLLTSRPYFATNIQADFYLENIGFTSDDIYQYIKQFFSDFAAEAKTSGLLGLLKKNLNIKGIAHVPMVLEFICSAWLDNFEQQLTDTINLTMTTLYNKVLSNSLGRYLKRKEVSIEVMTAREIEGHIFCVNSLAFMEEVAWHLMKSKKLTFSLQDKDIDKIVEKYFSNINYGQREGFISQLGKVLGLLRGVGPHKSNLLEQKYYFVHLTFQEFFAARYVVKNFDDQNILLFVRDNKYNRRYEIVWQFVAGLLNQDKDTKDNALQQYFDILWNEPKPLLEIHQMLLVMRCWGEANLLNIRQKQEIQNQLIKVIKNDYLEITNMVADGLINYPLYLSIKEIYEACFQTVEKRENEYLKQTIHLLDDKLLKLVVNDEVIVDKLLLYIKRYPNERRIAEVIDTVGESFIKKDKIIELLLKHFLKSRDYYIGGAAARALVKLEVNQREAVEYLLDSLQEFSVAYRAVSVLIKLQIKEKWVIDRLLQMLEKNIAAACEVLVGLQIRNEWVIEKLRSLLRDNLNNARLLVIKTLIGLGIKDDSQLVRVLEEYLQCSDDENVLFAIRMLKIIIEDSSSDKIFGRISSNPFESDFCSSKSVGSYKKYVDFAEKHKSLILILQNTLLKTRNSHVRFGIIVLLMRVDIEKPTAKTLLDLTSQINNEVKPGAVNIQEIPMMLCELSKENKTIIHDILSLYQLGKYKPYRSEDFSIFSMLAELSDKSKATIEKVLELLKSNIHTVCKAAAFFLIKIHVNEEWVINELLAIVKDNKQSIKIQSGPVWEAAYVLAEIATGNQQVISEFQQILQHNKNWCVRPEPINPLRLLSSSDFYDTGKVACNTHLVSNSCHGKNYDAWWCFNQKVIEILCMLGDKSEFVENTVLNLLQGENEESFDFGTLWVMRRCQIKKMLILEAIIEKLQTKHFCSEASNALEYLNLAEKEWRSLIEHVPDSSWEKLKTYKAFPFKILLWGWTEKNIDYFIQPILAKIAEEKLLVYLNHDFSKLYFWENDDLDFVALSGQHFQRLLEVMAKKTCGSIKCEVISSPINETHYEVQLLVRGNDEISGRVFIVQNNAGLYYDQPPALISNLFSGSVRTHNGYLPRFNFIEPNHTKFANSTTEKVIDIYGQTSMPIIQCVDQQYDFISVDNSTVRIIGFSPEDTLHIVDKQAVTASCKDAFTPAGIPSAIVEAENSRVILENTNCEQLNIPTPTRVMARMMLASAKNSFFTASVPAAFAGLAEGWGMPAAHAAALGSEAAFQLVIASGSYAAIGSWYVTHTACNYLRVSRPTATMLGASIAIISGTAEDVVTNNFTWTFALTQTAASTIGATVAAMPSSYLGRKAGYVAGKLFNSAMSFWSKPKFDSYTPVSSDAAHVATLGYGK